MGNDDTAPAWASALLVTLNEIRAEMRERFDALETQLVAMERRIGRQIDQRIIDQATGPGRAPGGRGE